MYNFDVKTQTENCINWIRDWFKENGNEETKAIVGISGGKDSAVVAGLLVKALGKDRVIGVMMPNGEQKDISDSIKVCKFLGIKNFTINIIEAYRGLTGVMLHELDLKDSTSSYETNTPARLRMTTLYGVGAMIGNCRVANTCNLSEDKVGYATLHGDSAGDFAPISHLTTEEVVAIGDYLGLPSEITHKTPSDGMCGKSDEDNLGFTYEEINKIIRNNEEGPNYKKIREKYSMNKFKTELIRIPYFNPVLSDFLL